MIILNRRVIVTFLIYTLILGAGFWFGIRPLLNRVDLAKANLHDQNQNFLQQQRKLDQLGTLSHAVADINQAKALSTLALPTGIDQDRLIVTLETLAKRDEVRLDSISVGNLPTTAPTTTAPAASTSAAASKIPSAPVTLTVTGPYGKVQQFVDDLEAIQRLIAISSVTITQIAASTDVTAALQANAFYFTAK